MKQLPRLLAVTTDAIFQRPDFSARVTALAGIGPALGVLVRAPASTARAQAEFAARVTALARPPGAAVLLHGRPDLARAAGADGVQLRRDDLAPRDARLVFSTGWIGVSIHDRAAAEAARAEAADFLVAGNVFETASHPGRPARGLDWLAELCSLGLPVLAIGGITPDRAALVRRAGAWGAAAITALWDAADPAAAARGILAAWGGGEGDRNGGALSVTLNGATRRLAGALTVEELLLELGLDSRAVVVELNRRIVRKHELGATRLAEGDAVELVHFVGGG